MVSKSRIKFISSLAHKKYREANQMFVGEGAKIAEEALRTPSRVENVYAYREWLDLNEELVSGLEPGSVEETDEREMRQITQLATPSPVLVVCKLPENIYKAPEKGLNLYLESIRDPGNMGTIIRLADWYGLEKIYCSADCVDAYNAKVVQASMGSIFRIQVQYCERISDGLPGYAAVLGGDILLHEMGEVAKDCMILIGNESQGLSDETLKAAKFKVSIPQFGSAESLNAAAATAVFLDNFRRISRMSKI